MAGCFALTFQEQGAGEGWSAFVKPPRRTGRWFRRVEACLDVSIRVRVAPDASVEAATSGQHLTWHPRTIIIQFSCAQRGVQLDMAISRPLDTLENHWQIS